MTIDVDFRLTLRLCKPVTSILRPPGRTATRNREQLQMITMVCSCSCNPVFVALPGIPGVTGYLLQIYQPTGICGTWQNLPKRGRCRALYLSQS